MRITMQTIHQSVLNNLHNIAADKLKLNQQIASGKQMSRISDNPVNMVNALGLRSNLAEISQYQENLLYGSKIIAASEQSLRQIKDLALDAKVLAIQQVNAHLTVEQRAAASVEVCQLFEQTVLLANVQVGGKHIFGGFRTTGYTEMEPTPFISGLADGYRVSGSSIAAIDGELTVTVSNTPVSANDLAVNGNNVGEINSAPAINGLNMTKALNARNSIEAADPAVNVNLTTLYGGASATAEGGHGGETMHQTVNNVAFEVIVPNGATANQVAALAAAAINGIIAQTGVSARVGDGANGGVINSVVLFNSQPGNEADIVVGTLTNANASTGLSAATYSAGTINNTGQISISSISSFEFSSPNHADDSILNALGLGGGTGGFSDVAGDGSLIYGARLHDGDLLINGAAISSAVSDDKSTIYSDTSASAKATAINNLSQTTGVRAIVTPLSHQAAGAVVAGDMGTGDLIINGVDIFDGSPSAIISQDSDNALINAINNKQGVTGIAASRDSDGKIILAAQDGRNLHLQTTANGGNITSLNHGGTDMAADRVYFGAVQLHSDRQFTLKTTVVGAAPETYEHGLAALGLAGGAVVTGEKNDIKNDGKLAVISIAAQDGNVRYAGDRDNHLAVKVGPTSTIAVSKNGREAIKDTGVFSVLKGFENALRGQNYTTVTGIHQASDTTVKLNSGNTGLEQMDEPFTDGILTITVTDHSQNPPTDFAMGISVDVAQDSLSDIAVKINGIPGITASWDNDGYLQLATTDPDRYTFAAVDSSNFLEMTGTATKEMQIQALTKSISDLEVVMNNLAKQISDFGARANRIDVQNNIYISLELATTTNLSAKEDTDIVQALMELKNRQIAFEAALSTAAKTMQLSLVNFL